MESKITFCNMHFDNIKEWDVQESFGFDTSVDLDTSVDKSGTSSNYFN